MSAKVIRYHLINDYTDRTAADVMTANPGVFSSTSDVPDYLYLSMKTLFLGAGAASSDFANRVVIDMGGGQTHSGGDIAIISAYRTSSNLDSSFPPSLREDTAGSEVSEYDLIVSLPRKELTIDKLESVINRMVYILDYAYRGYRGVSSHLSPVADKAIDSNSLYAVVLGEIRNVHTSQARVRLKSLYTRHNSR